MSLGVCGVVWCVCVCVVRVYMWMCETVVIAEGWV